MDRIKSAFEKAMEKVEQLESPRQEQVLEWKLVPEGRRLAASYLRGEGTLFPRLSNCGDTERRYLGKGITEVLLANLRLPKNEAIGQTNQKVLEALERLKQNKRQVKEVNNRIKYVCDQYAQFGLVQQQQAYQQLKQQLQAQVQQAVRSKAPNAPAVEINVETLPEFQQQWLRMAGQMDQQYEQHLEEYRKMLLELQ